MWQMCVSSTYEHSGVQAVHQWVHVHTCKVNKVRYFGVSIQSVTAHFAALLREGQNT